MLNTHAKPTLTSCGQLGKRAARPSVVITTLAAAPRSAQSAEGKAAGALLICAVEKTKKLGKETVCTSVCLMMFGPASHSLSDTET